MSAVATLRKSQRLALSCTECARRKTRCSKTIPCSSCRDRRIADTCHRESVRIVKKQDRRQHNSVSSKTRLEPPLAISPSSNSSGGGGSMSQGAGQTRALLPNDTLTDGANSRIVHQSPKVSGHPIASRSSVLDIPGTETTVTLEFLTYGRRNLLNLGGSLSASELPRFNALASPGSPYWSPNAEFGNLPQQPPWDTVLSPDDARRLISYHESRLAWMHNVVHMPTFREEFESNLVESPRDGTWLALYYALLCTTFFHMEEDEIAKFDIDTTARLRSSQALYHESLRCLYDANFMATHTVYSVQTICILMQVAHNLDQSDFISVLIATGIRISQCLNLHRLGRDRPISDSAAWKPRDAVRRTLVDREVKKRVWWFLVRQDWLQIPYQNTYLIHPSQFNTPQALNCHEQLELMVGDGETLPQPDDVYTQSTYTNGLSKIAVIIWKQQDRMCRIGHPGDNLNGLQKLYDQVLWADRELKQVYAGLPIFIRDISRTVRLTPDLPSYIAQIASTKLLSVAHKTSTIHRHFLLRSFRDRRFSYTLLSCIATAEQCILDLERWQNDPAAQCMRHMWTYSTQLVSCCITLALASILRRENELFFDGSRVHGLATAGRNMLHKLEISSSIARRGVILLDLLLKIDVVDREPGEAHLDLSDIIRQVLCMEMPNGQELEESSEVNDFIFPWGTHAWNGDFDMADFEF